MGIGSSNMMDLLNYLSYNDGGNPLGTVISFMGNNPPKGYLKCDGTIYNISDYIDLSEFFTEQFGSTNYFGGDGTSTFAVPDLRGEFLRGTGTATRNVGSGAAVGVHQQPTLIPEMIHASNIGNMNHVTLAQDTSLYSDKAYNSFIKNQDTNFVRSGESRTMVRLSVDSKWTDAVTSFAKSTRPTNTAVLYCIKYTSPDIKFTVDESKVGIWIDGKPLYRKVFTGNTPNTPKKFTTIPNTNIDGIRNVTSINFLMNGAGANDTLFVPPANISGQNLFAQYSIGNGLNIYIETNHYANKPFTAIIEYTKNTD